MTLAVAFSGGGTRAAALSYGVMQELRDTRVRIDGKEQRLLDAINVISSVSGGSFTSAYYGLYGDRLFVDYEQRFLRSDVEGALKRGLAEPGAVAQQPRPHRNGGRLLPADAVRQCDLRGSGPAAGGAD